MPLLIGSLGVGHLLTSHPLLLIGDLLKSFMYVAQEIYESIGACTFFLEVFVVQFYEDIIGIMEFHKSIEKQHICLLYTFLFLSFLNFFLLI